MRFLLLALLLTSCATTSQHKPDPSVLEYWGPDSVEWWEEVRLAEACNAEPDECVEVALDATE